MKTPKYSNRWPVKSGWYWVRRVSFDGYKPWPFHWYITRVEVGKARRNYYRGRVLKKTKNKYFFVRMKGMKRVFPQTDETPHYEFSEKPLQHPRVMETT